jgi:hypothetical protein
MTRGDVLRYALSFALRRGRDRARREEALTEDERYALPSAQFPACVAAAGWWRSPVEGYSLGLESVDGLGVVVVVVVVAGEAAAWAGTITDLTTGLTQRSGKTSGLNEPPPNATCKMRRRSTVI